jgi:hypothetical protein
MGDLGAAARVEDPLKASFGHVCGFIIEWQRHISSIKIRSILICGWRRSHAKNLNSEEASMRNGRGRANRPLSPAAS